jgi:L-threonylcarbamoyladenylate synthase
MIYGGFILTEILEPTEKNLLKAAEAIRKNGLVAFPTETVYGLGGCAFSEIAIVKIFEVKKRPRFDPLIVHIAEKDDYKLLCSTIPSTAEKLIEAFCPGPLTLVLPKREKVPDIVTSGLDTVAVRMPSHPIALQLIQYSMCPIAAPSANRFGHVSPTRAEDVLSDLGDSVDFILDGGPTLVGVESTVVFVTEEEIILLRPGGIPIEDIEKVIGRVNIKRKMSKLLSPGLTKKHYSPKTPLYIYEGNLEELVKINRDDYALLTPAPLFTNDITIYPLSQAGDVKEIAANLFHQLRKLERMDYRAIIAIPVKQNGLGHAVMDRLIRASTGTVKIENQKLVFIDR